MNIRRKQKNKIKRKRRLIFVFTFLVFSIAGFILVMNSKRLLVTSVEIKGNNTVLDIDIKDSINRVIDKNIVLIPMKNIFFISTRRLEGIIKNDFPKIYNAHISIKDGSRLLIDVEERRPHSLWCKYNNENTINDDKKDLLNFDEECYFADQKGFIYTMAPYFSDGIFEKIYTTDDMLGIGDHILGTDEFNNFFKFVDSLNNNFNVIVDHIVLNNNETKIYINSLLNKRLTNRPYIVYHTDSSYEVIGRNMNLMINHELFKKDFSKNPNKLIFIDLRIPDQIRYKFNTTEDKLFE